MTRLMAMIAAALAMVSSPVAAQQAEMPPGIADPDTAITDPMFNDPVLFWRIISAPKNVYEPDPYFYWPAQPVHGAAPADLPRADGKTTIPTAALAAMEDWAKARDSTALIVIHRGVIQLERYWNGATAEAALNGRAITRSVTPLLLGFAVADGKLELDDPIGRHIPAWADDPRGQVTVRQLAQNASGLEVAPSLPITQLLGNKDLCLVYCGDVVRAALAYDLTGTPGAKFEVAQENMQLLAHVIEQAMGTRIETLLSERVWSKIGASDAYVQLDRPGGVARMMCCMRARAMDWARLGLLVADAGRWQGTQVLPQGWTGTMAAPSPANPNFGLGLWRGHPFVAMRPYFQGQKGLVPQSEPFLADDVLMMEGGGWRIVHIVPSADLVIFRHGPSHPDWDMAFLVNTALRSLRK
ncbi:MAG: serine hydrolase domain-containing protein [Polymorphobacter sp.]|uniref:serine hydrolase domain-containing protein n=1 Tax=Polymorphobacter sp. TaxID=1909290 RepID=UPI003A84303E